MDSTKMYRPHQDAPPALDPLRPLRSRLVGRRERPKAGQALTRPLAPGLYEVLVARRGAGQPTHVPTPADLAGLGLAQRTLFRAARRNTCRGSARVHVHELLPGGRVWRVQAEAGSAGLVALELERLLVHDTSPRLGWLLGVPCDGLAALVPLGAPPNRALADLGMLGGVDPDAATTPLDLAASARALATLTTRAHACLPRPVSREVYWIREGRLEPVRQTGRGRIQDIVPDPELAQVMERAQHLARPAPGRRVPPPPLRPAPSP